VSQPVVGINMSQQPTVAPVVGNPSEFSTPNQAAMPSNTSGVVPPTGVVNIGVPVANIAHNVPVETTNI
jgi:hypothetical protein